ncbi:MAG: hypothetical protein KKA07_12325 [Bacteroidetes bacterium]|nr:hypothetical protein [Bacteroidota bacterium]MBU1719844.1 hypothetical protein [Bacteroidota bacterium]
MNLSKKGKSLILALTSVLFAYLTVELGCMLILKFSPGLHFEAPYFNRQASPYYVYENTPGFQHSDCIRQNPDEEAPIVDANGFISDHHISQFKDTGTFRVFLTGGSAAFGTGQSAPYDKVKKYPQGVYSFDASIAGQLQQLLQQQMPDRKVEVINACATQRMLHQSLMYYLETLSKFNPDVVISMDGKNDVSTFIGVCPFRKARTFFEPYLQLREIVAANEYKGYSYIRKLINALKIKNFKRMQKANVKKYMQYYFNYDYSKITNEKYEKIKSRLILNSRRYTDLVRQFAAVCHINNVSYIYCMQPMLYREKANKPLSDTEIAMRDTITPANIRILAGDISNEVADTVETAIHLTQKYFIDDYLSAKMRKEAIADGYGYIDINEEMNTLSREMEFYTDYCHLTFEGNAFVAKCLSHAILGQLLYER